MVRIYKTIASIILGLLLVGRVWAADPLAARIRTTTTNFNLNLSVADTDVQKALDTLDDLVAGGGGSYSWTAAGDSGTPFLVGDTAETVTLKGAGINTVSAGSNIWTVTGTEVDPQVGAVTLNKWCIGDGSAVQCTENAPTGGGATWTMTADSGTDQLIDTTETVSLKGTAAAGISTIVGATNTWTIVQTKADTSTNGYLWSTDWNTFNGKQAALGYTPAYQWTIAGGTGADLIGNTAEIWTITGETASGHSTAESGNTLTINQTKASTTVNGYLWSTDWTTFNAKQATIANYVGTVADGTGIDGTATGAGSTYTPTFDATELGNLTWGSGAGIVWTIDMATDVTITWTTAKTTFSGTVDATTLTEGTNAVYNSTEVPGGELGGTWASPTIDDSVAVTSWNLTTPTITTSLTTSTPTTLTAAELDRLDGLAGVIVTDATACTDLEGIGLAITTGVLGFAPAEVTAPTWGAGAQQVWTFDLATDYTVTWTTGLATFSGDITVSGGDIKSGNIAFTIGDATTDSIALTTDGTGNAELSLPADSLGIADIDWGTGTGQVPLSKGFNIGGTISNTSDFGNLWKTPVAITITSVNVTLTGGAASWSIVGQLDECDANGANCATVDTSDITCTQGTNAADDGTLSNASIDAGDWLGWHTTSQTWTTGGTAGITFNYTQ